MYRQDVSSRNLRRLESTSETAVVAMSLSNEIVDVQCSAARRAVIHELLPHIDV